jgi:uncharacterized protein YfaS (alpha-2-macroglobulin family)
MSKRLLLFFAGAVTLTMLIVPFIASYINSASAATKINPAFGAYVSAYTSGMISNESKIRVRLSEDYTGEIQYDKPTSDSYFDFSPSIEGETFWIDARTLEFRPAHRLPSDQSYTAKFKLSKLISNLPADLEVMEFNFRTLKQGVVVQIEGTKTIDKKTLRWQQLKGTLHTNDAADDKEAEKTFTATQNGKILPVRWTHESNHTTRYFVVDSIARTDIAGEIVMSWDAKSIGGTQTGSLKQVIPSLKDFIVTGVRLEQGEQQCIIIQFSDPLDEKQSVDGLITLNGDIVPMRYTIQDNDIKAYPSEHLNGDYTLRVSKGIKNILKTKMPAGYSTGVKFEDLKPGIRLVGTGVILPNTDRGMLFPFQAVGLNAVDVRIIKIYENNIPQFLQVSSLDGSSELYRVGKKIIKKKIDLNVSNKAELSSWGTYSLDLSELVKTEPGAIYRVTLSFKQDYSTYNCPKDSSETPVAIEEHVEEEEDADGYGYYSDYSDDSYYWWDGDRDDPCDPSYYYGRSISKNFLASDLGLLAKKGNDGGMLLAVNQLQTTTPIAGAQLEVYDFQHQLITKSVSDAEGLARVNVGKKKPFLLIAKHGTQRGYLKLDDGTSLSIGAFDVAGATVQKGLKGFIYGERGVWRPGDTLFIGFILEDKQKTLPATHPVTMELYNPRGQLVEKMIKAQGVNGFYSFAPVTDPEAPTGRWIAKIKVGGAVFTKDLKVESIMPNRLKIMFEVGKNGLVSAADQTKLTLQSQWLHGAKARNLKADVRVSLAQTTTTFKGHDNFSFDDPASSFYSEEQTVFDGRLDENGVAQFEAGVDIKQAPGMLKAAFNTRVFEEGGAFSLDRFTVNYSPYKNYVGVLVPEGKLWGGMLETGKDHQIIVGSVDEYGNKTSRSNLQVKVYKLDWRWWWSSSHESLAHYVSGNYYSPVLEQTISTTNGRGSFKLKVENENWGRYLIRVTDMESGHSCGSISYFDWPYWDGAGTKNPDAASILQFTTDKTTYKPGESIQLSIPSPGQGRALISVESGSRIINSYWVETQTKGTFTHAIPVTSEMAPNVYINVTLIQPHGQVKNDAPIRLFGVVPVIIDDPASHLAPQVQTAVVWKPEEQASVTVSEKDGKAMTYTLAIVDEGLLDLTRFKTPDPHGHFYAREALGVKTWDMYDMVMGAYGAEMSKVLGIGGDGDDGNKGGQKANRFKPMVKFMGPFELKKGSKQTHNFMMPQYVGSVRVMVIAGQDFAYGHVDKAVPVRKPLMLLGTLPRVVGPGETVDLPVNVFAMEAKVKNVNVQVTTNNMFTVEGGNTQTLQFNEVGDQVVTFRLNVSKAVGLGKVKITASGAGEKAEHSIEIDVRHPNVEVSDAYEATLEPGKSWEMDYTPFGLTGTNSAQLEFSTVPPLNLGQRLEYLIGYPHGCLEQTTSAAFPQLFLPDLVKMSENKKKKVEFNIRAAITRLQRFQTSSGAFGYWPGDQYPSEWGSNYAGHFLLEAEAKGYHVSSNVLENWKKFQRERALNYTPRYDRYYYYNDDLMQAYRLYTLALAKAPEVGAMNRLKEQDNLSTAAKWRLAAAYQLAGQQEVAAQMVKGLSTEIKPYNEFSGTFGSSDRDLAMILETMSIMGGTYKVQAAVIAKKISETLNRKNYYMNTQATAYSLLALCKFSGGDKTSKGFSCDFAINGKKNSMKESLPMASTDIEIVGTNRGKVSVKNTGSNVLFVRMVLNGIPDVGNETAANNYMNMTVDYATITGKPMDPTQIVQGTDFVATVTVTNPGMRGEYREMALTQVFPSGWEIRNENMEATVGANVKASAYDFRDTRDDRVHTYFFIGPNKSKTFKVYLNATYTGKFYLPGTFCEAMYDNSVNARKEGQWVQVVPDVVN